ncbi:chemotaxis protein, partial [Campylobacter estrildidarum]
MFKSLSIGTKLILFTAISIVLGLAIMIAFISFQVSSNMGYQAEESVKLASKRYVNYMEGSLNEPIMLSRAVGMSITDSIKDDGFIDMNILTNLVKDTLDGSMHTTYAFLYLNDPSVISGGDKEKFMCKDGVFSMVLNDTTPGVTGGIKIIRLDNAYQKISVLETIQQQANANNPKVAFGKVTKLNFGNGEFIGINFAMPLFNKTGKYIGAIGFSLEFSEIAKVLLDPSLDFHKGDQRILLSNDAEFVIHENPKALLQKLDEYNHAPTAKTIAEAVRSNKDLLLDNFLTSTGFESYASVVSFSTINNSSHWSILVTTPKASVLAPLYKLQFAIIIVAIVFLFIILAIIYICVRKLVTVRIGTTLHSLENFFLFLNHKRNDVKTIEVHNNDELGQMGKIINENILATKQGLEQDNQAVKESVSTVQTVERGD